VRQVSHLQE